MTDHPPSPAGADDLLACLQASTAAGPADLEAQLLDCIGLLSDSDDPAAAATERLLRQLHLRLQQSRLTDCIALTQARFTALHFRQQTLPGARMRPDLEAMAGMFAAALQALPHRRRKRLFDAEGYLALNPDVAAAGVDPLRHYLSNGTAEGRMPALLGPARHTDLADLDSRDPPRFLEEYPEALRQRMLDSLGRAAPVVSVILPSWNRVHMLERAVNSALLQSYAPAEVIVVDDGSTDGTAAWLRARYPEPLAEARLVLLERPHEGVSAARNAGLARARGDILAYLDSDNQWEPDHLLTACAALCDPRAGAEAVYTALCRHNLDHGWSDLLFRPFDRAALEAANYIDLNSFVHRRGLYDRCGGFDTGLTRLVDWDLILRYTAAAAPLALPVITGHYILASAGLGNISDVEPLAPNMARIRARLAGETP